MTEDRPLTAAEQGELRHDLRTPFNHILGYVEMLLESAADDGFEALSPSLKRLHTDAKELLATINAGLASDRDVMLTELTLLGETLRCRVPLLCSQVERLLQDVREAGHESAIADLQRVQRSVGMLEALGQERLHPTAITPNVTPIQPEEPIEEARPATLGPGLVLVVDDNEINRDLLCRRLEREGLTPVAARDGREALDLLSCGEFDLLLLDILMPVMNGYEVLRAVRASSVLRDLPVVMISAMDEMQSVVRCIEMGAEDFLPKPFDPVLLRARVGACLEKKRLRDRELEYLRGVATLEESASAVESGTFAPEKLSRVASREDELGRLARVFQHMATEVQAREKRLKEQVAQLRIEIDMVRLTKQVEEVTQDPVFDSLRGARDRLKQRRKDPEKE